MAGGGSGGEGGDDQRGGESEALMYLVSFRVIISNDL